ncbi:MAG: Uma2 family endonuclease [Lachnospiraceae bacterium]|nr:Uma2 family endonuclease [Lachnospiraceae bacterium]
MDKDDIIGVEKNEERADDFDRMIYSDSCSVREPEVVYGRRSRKQGEYTAEDYFALPDGTRKELIHGVLYDMASPSFVHQKIAYLLVNLFNDYIEKRNGECVATIAPCDVEIENDGDCMIFQPDVLIVCDRDKIRDRNIVCGAPDFVVEILSPSTKIKDRTIKLREYRKAGVRECWLIDPERKEVEVYVFRDPDMATLPKVYGFEDTIPVGIFGGECVVDFANIYRRIRNLY